MAYGTGERDNFAWETFSLVFACVGFVVAFVAGVFIAAAGPSVTSAVFAVIGVVSLLGGVASFAPLKRRTTRIAAQRALDHARDSDLASPLRAGVPVDNTGLRLVFRMLVAASVAEAAMAGFFLWVIVHPASGEPASGAALTAGLFFVALFLALPVIVVSVRWAPLRSVEPDGLRVGWRDPGRMIAFGSIKRWRVIGARAALRLDDGSWRALSVPLSDRRIPEMLKYYLGESG